MDYKKPGIYRVSLDGVNRIATFLKSKFIDHSPRSEKMLLSAAVLLFVCAGVKADETTAPAGTAPLVVNGKACCAIVAPDHRLTQLAAQRLAEYLREHARADVPILADKDIDPHSTATLIVLDGTADHRLLKQFEIRSNVADDRADAYHLQVRLDANRAVVAVAGKSPSGARYGTYRLMEEMDISPGAATVPVLNLAESPFFKTRSVSLFNVWRVPVEVIRQCNLESWPAEKIRRNTDMYDLFGFNAIETHDRFHEGFLQAVYGISRKEWRDKVHSMCDRAHENGMTVFLRQWANSVALPVEKIEGGFTPFGFVNLVPDIPEERRRWETEIRDYVAQNHAKYIDHFIGHWADAGGVHAGSKATIKDALQLHNELRASLRAINPRIETSFNLWFMQNPKGHRGWPGYKDHRSVTTPGILERDVIIAQATRSKNWKYSEQVTTDILKDGYRAAAWTWRRADTEVARGDPGLRVRVHGVMREYFKGMPESARQLEWHNVERNQHGIASDVNYFVASKLMWDPMADVDAALTKYCALVFGKQNADAAAEAFLTIEATRDVENTVSGWVVQNPVEAAARARRALQGISQMQLPRDHRSRLPSVVSLREMVSQISDALKSIAENAELISGPLRRLDELSAAKQPAEAKKIRAELQDRVDSRFGTIAAGMEARWLRERLQGGPAKPAARNTTDALGFRTSNISALEKVDAGFRLTGGNGIGTAVRRLKPSAKRKTEFQFSMQVAVEGLSRNGGLAFGEAPARDELVQCMVYIRAKALEISGKGILHPVRVDMKGVDPSRPIIGTVIVDFEQHRITFKVGEHSAEAPLAPEIREIAWHGYAVDRATTLFSPIEINRRKVDVPSRN